MSIDTKPPSLGRRWIAPAEGDIVRWDLRPSNGSGVSPKAGPVTATNSPKSGALYLLIVGGWFLLLAAFTTVEAATIARAVASGQSLAVIALLVINGLFISYFWLNGVKDLAYVIYYYLRRKSLAAAGTPPRHGATGPAPCVLMLYCTADDFSEDSLFRSLKQDYTNAHLVILDDSSDERMKARVDAFASQYGAEVIRRSDRVGFKAGNLNNYLAGRTDYDYFVLLDSDEVIPPEFITRALDYFLADSHVGIVQANHRATRNRTYFMKLFARGVDSHWPTYQAVKTVAGFMSLLGHGAMVSRTCYQAAGGFPHVVAEDLCFSIEARIAGLYAVFAADIVCEEEYPIDYLAFKKRHSKWTQGNLEFIRAYTRRIFRSNMTWFEKLDIVLFTYNLPLTAFFALYIVLNVIAFPLMGYQPHYPAWLLIPTLVFLLSPMLNDIIYHGRRTSAPTLVWYLLNTFVLYGSMFFVSLYASIRGMLGVKATFIVTPKESERVRLGSAILRNWREICFAAALVSIAALTTHSPLPVVMIAAPSVLSVYLTLMTATPLKRPARHKIEAIALINWDELLNERVDEIEAGRTSDFPPPLCG